MDFYEAISNVGFPIAVCMYMIYNNNKTLKSHTETISEMKNVISENTTVMKELSNFITHFITGSNKHE